MQPQLRVPAEFDTSALRLQRLIAVTTYDLVLLLMVPVFGALILLSYFRAGVPAGTRIEPVAGNPSGTKPDKHRG